jgi:hypothetical protein
VLLVGPVVCHGSAGNASSQRDRRALAFRYCGEDVRFAPRHASMPLLWDHGLEPGDRLTGNLFPQVWPQVIEEEIARRMQGPEPPSNTQVGAFSNTWPRRASVRRATNAASSRAPEGAGLERRHITGIFRAIISISAPEEPSRGFPPQRPVNLLEV